MPDAGKLAQLRMRAGLRSCSGSTRKKGDTRALAAPERVRVRDESRLNRGWIVPTQASARSMIEHFIRRELRTLRLELEAFPEETLIWEVPAGLPNSSGTLTLHLVGNLRHYIGVVLGGGDYLRDRELEFSARDLPRSDLLDAIAAAEADVLATLPRLSPSQLSEQFPELIRGHYLTVGDLLLQLAVHLSYHLGQVSYHRRIVTGDVRGVGALAAGDLFEDR